MVTLDFSAVTLGFSAVTLSDVFVADDTGLTCPGTSEFISSLPQYGDFSILRNGNVPMVIK